MIPDELEKRLVEIIDEDPDSVVVRIPKAILNQQPLHLRYAQATSSDIERVLAMEALAFSPEDGGTLDPPETREGVERFLQSGGEVLLLSRDNGFLERIPLENLLRMEFKDLSVTSPLRQIAEKRDVLERARSAYEFTGKELWYGHGIGTVVRQIGDGSTMAALAFGRSLKRLAEYEESSNTRVLFGYIDIGPTRESVNIPSFKMSLGVGAVIDGFEHEVYSPEVPYLRVSHGVNYRFEPINTRSVDLSRENYIEKIIGLLDQGFIGTKIVEQRNSGSYFMIFQKNLSK
jgi:hypothetical protein